MLGRMAAEEAELVFAEEPHGTRLTAIVDHAERVVAARAACA